MKTTEFADWLKSELRRLEWSQAAFARRANFAPSTVSTWLSGDRIPDPDSIDVVADVLFADRDYLLSLAGHRPLDDTPAPGDPRRGITALVQRVQWSPEREHSVRKILEGYIEFDRKGQAK